MALLQGIGEQPELNPCVLYDFTCTTGIGVEEVSLLQGIGEQPEGSLPRAVQQVQRSVHPLPVGQVVECIADKTLKNIRYIFSFYSTIFFMKYLPYGFAIASFENMLRRKNQRLHLQQVLKTNKQ